MNKSNRWVTSIDISYSFDGVVGQKRVGREIDPSKSIFYFRYWIHVRYGDTKKIYICYVLYMVCIVFVKMNQTMFYRKMVYVKEGVREKVAEFPREKARN